MAVEAYQALRQYPPTVQPQHAFSVGQDAPQTHEQALAANIGWAIDPTRWAERQREREALRRQTVRIADALESRGISCRGPSIITALSAVTGLATPLTAWRAIRFLPEVAARDRRPVLNAFKLFNQVDKKAKYFRYIVITTKELVPAFGDLRGSIQELQRSISKWSHEVAKRFGKHVILRSTEFTRDTAENRGMSDRYSPETVVYHPHCNVVISSDKAVSKEEWAKFLSDTWNYFGSMWKDNGRIENENEIIKYMLKPSELDGATDDELVWLYEQTRRLKIVQPMGRFAGFVQALESDRQKVVMVRGPEGVGHLRKVTKPTRLDHSAREGEGGGGIAQNTILGLTLPSWQHSPWAEPSILVQHYEPRACGEAAHQNLEDIKAEMMMAREAWDRSGAPAPALALQIAALVASKVEAEASLDDDRQPSFKVHKSRPTVRGSDPPRRPPRVVSDSWPTGPTGPKDLSPSSTAQIIEFRRPK
jgi:hypothetical protein